MNEILDSLKAKQAERDGLILELENIAALKALGITRHDIVKSRPVTFYEKGKNVPTGEADIIMRDGTHHVVPARLLRRR